MMVEMSCGCSPSMLKETMAPLSLAVPVDLEPVEPAQALVRVVLQARLVRRDALAPHLHHVVQRRTEADGLHDRRRAGLELVRRSCRR